MDFEKLTIEEIRKLDKDGMRETELAIRRELASMRMDIYTSANAQSGKTSKLKTGLARLLTVKTAQLKAAGKTVAAPKPAAKAPAKAKKAVAARKASKAKKKA